ADGKRVITTDMLGKVYVWERDTGRLVTEWQAHPSCAYLVGLSLNGKLLLTGRGRFEVLVWNLDACLKERDLAERTSETRNYRPRSAQEHPQTYLELEVPSPGHVFDGVTLTMNTTTMQTGYRAR